MTISFRGLISSKKENDDFNCQELPCPPRAHSVTLLHRESSLALISVSVAVFSGGGAPYPTAWLRIGADWVRDTGCFAGCCEVKKCTCR